MTKAKTNKQTFMASDVPNCKECGGSWCFHQQWRKETLIEKYSDDTLSKKELKELTKIQWKQANMKWDKKTGDYIIEIYEKIEVEA